MLKVLLVDDEPFILEGMSVIIDWKEEGFQIVGKVSDAVEGLQFLKKEKVDLVITDIKMPVMSGLELLERVRSEEISDAFFCVLSGYNDFNFVRTALRNDCIDYLLKPIEKEELLNVLKKVKEYRQQEQKQEVDVSHNRITEQKNIHTEQESAITQNSEGEPKNQPRGVLAKIEEDMRENYRENLTLKDMSRKYYLNSAYLGQIFKKQYGESFKECLNRIRIEKAVEILLRTDMKIYEVADEVGYNDIDYFINRFIAVKGCTPAKFRKQMNDRKN